MHKLYLICAAALALTGCVTAPDGSKTVDKQRICETTLRVTNTVAGVASVLRDNGFAPEAAQKVALAAIGSGDAVHFLCAVLAAKDASQ